MKRKSWLTIILFIFFFIPICGVAYDKEPGSFQEFQTDDIAVDLSTTIVEIVTTGHGIGIVPAWAKDFDETKEGWVRARGHFDLRGVGFAIGDYIITAAHVVHPTAVLIQTGKYFYWHTYLIKELSKTISVGDPDAGIPAHIHYINHEYDIAVLSYYGSMVIKSFDYEVTWTSMLVQLGWMQYMEVDLLEVDDAVAVIARQRDENRETNWQFEVRYGKVTSTGIDLPEGLEEYMPAFSMNDFTFDIPVYPGDSGSPVFAFDDGKPVIVGIARAYCPWGDEVRSYATRTDFLKRLL